MGIVSVKRLKLYGYHGCLPEEAVVGTWFEVDIDVHYDYSAASESDNLDETVDYVVLCQIAKEEIEKRSKLIEHVIRRIMDRIKAVYPKSEKVKIVLYKLNPPANANLDHVSVSLEG